MFWFTVKLEEKQNIFFLQSTILQNISLILTKDFDKNKNKWHKNSFLPDNVYVFMCYHKKYATWIETLYDDFAIWALKVL